MNIHFLTQEQFAPRSSRLVRLSIYYKQQGSSGAKYDIVKAVLKNKQPLNIAPFRK